MESKVVQPLVVVSLTVATLVFLCGCRRKANDEAKKPVSIDDTKIGYPGVEEQRKRIGKYSLILDERKPVAKPDETLRQMTEQVPLGYIETHLNRIA